MLNAEHAMRPQKQNDAASYNTQLGIAYLKQGDRPRAKRKLLANYKFSTSIGGCECCFGLF